VLFRKREKKNPLQYPTAASFWDQDKVKTIARATRVEITLTSFVAERSFGRLASYAPLEESQQAHGHVGWPSSLATITFSNRPVETHPPPKPATIGKWMYEVFGNEREGYLGRLHFTFLDQDHAIRTALKQAHAAALASGGGVTSLGIFKEEGVGDFSAMDREHGYSYESRFPFCGMQVTERYQSRHLKKWALPYRDEDFSKDGGPF
jgi:hypothetical protein